MRGIILSTLVVLWWVWLGVQIYSTGSTEVALELRDRFVFASSETWKFVESLHHVGLLFIAAISAWSEIFAPFLIDVLSFGKEVLVPQGLRLVEFLFPVVVRTWEVARPWITVVFLSLGEFVMNLPFEVQVSLVWIPAVLALARFDRRALNGLLLPIAWTTWKIFGATIGNSRKPLLVAGVCLPVYLSVTNFRSPKSKQRLLSLNSYWTIFPGLLWVENLLGISSGIYVSTLTVVTIWLFTNDGFAVVLDFVYSLSWKFFGDEVVEVVGKVTDVVRALNAKYGGTYRSIAVMTNLLEKVKSLKDMKNTYKIAVVVLTAGALLYWAFAVMNKIFALAVWPWFFWEMAKVCVHRSEPFYRSALAFAVFFFGLEYVVLPKAPYIVSAFISVFHLPIVFLGKMGAEVALDLMIRRLGLLFTRSKRSTRPEVVALPPASPKDKLIKLE